MIPRKVSKVVIPIAGMGTRFLPATKALPKELLPIVSTPIIHYIVEEAIRGGLETVIFVTSRSKIIIEDYFDPRDLTSYKLEQAGKHDLIDEVVELSKKIEIVSVRQYEPRGLGHAILTASPVVEGQPFAVILGDDIILPERPEDSGIAQCLRKFRDLPGGSVIGTITVPREQSRLYGMVALEGHGEGMQTADFSRITHFVEKPSPEDAPSDWAMPGRYVFEPAILDYIRSTRPGKGGEIQLTDAMQAMLATHTYFAQRIRGERHDTGDKLGYIMANVAVALRDSAMKEKLREWLIAKLEQV